MTGSMVRSYRERMERVMRYINENARESLSLEHLAVVAHLSPYHFHRVFKAYTGMTIGAYVRRYRLIIAADKLTTTKKSVLEIALDAGFGSHESFTRSFNSLFGLTPSAYRSRAKEDQAHVLPSPNPIPVQGGRIMGISDVKSVEMNVSEMPQMRVACVRHLGPYSSCHPAWEKLCAWGVRKGLFGPQTTFLGINWDDPDSTPPEEIRYDACFTVPDNVQAEDGVDIRYVGGCKHATIVHLGPFDRLESTYRKLYAAILDRDNLTIGEKPSLEIYRTDPKTTPPEKLVTEIYVPLAG